MCPHSANPLRWHYALVHFTLLSHRASALCIFDGCDVKSGVRKGGHCHVGLEIRVDEIKARHKNESPIDFVYSPRPRSRPRRGKVKTKTGLEPNTGVQSVASPSAVYGVPRHINKRTIANCCLWREYASKTPLKIVAV